MAETVKVPFRIGLPDVSVKSWNVKSNEPSVLMSEAGTVKTMVGSLTLLAAGEFLPGLGDRDEGPDDGRAGEFAGR